MAENERKEEAALGSLPELETACRLCDGEGRVHEEGKWRRCGCCDGAGYEPTEFGERVLNLLRHNFRPMREDMETG